MWGVAEPLAGVFFKAVLIPLRVREDRFVGGIMTFHNDSRVTVEEVDPSGKWSWHRSGKGVLFNYRRR